MSVIKKFFVDFSNLNIPLEKKEAELHETASF